MDNVVNSGSKEWEFGISELIILSQLLLIGGLCYVLFCIRQLVMKPPLMIKCECFNDMSHDDMLKVKDMYKSMLEQQQPPQEKSTEEQEKEVDNLNKED
jgi:hypothetical protein